MMVSQAAETMRDQHVGVVIVLDEGGRAVGILTDRDIVCRVVAARQDPASVRVESVMSRDIVMGRVSDRIEQAALTMRKKGIRRLPLADSDGRVVGLVSLDDLMVLLAGEMGLTAGTVRANRGP